MQLSEQASTMGSDKVVGDHERLRMSAAVYHILYCIGAGDSVTLFYHLIAEG